MDEWQPLLPMANRHAQTIFTRIITPQRVRATDAIRDAECLLRPTERSDRDIMSAYYPDYYRFD